MPFVVQSEFRMEVREALNSLHRILTGRFCMCSKFSGKLLLMGIGVPGIQVFPKRCVS